MAEFLIFIEDKGPNVNHWKKGDVITVQKDGWNWSQYELTAPQWRIFRVPGLLQSYIDAAVATVSPDAVTPPEQRRVRTWSIDFSSFPNVALFSGPRNEGIIDVQNKHALAALVKKK